MHRKEGGKRGRRAHRASLGRDGGQRSACGCTCSAPWLRRKKDLLGLSTACCRNLLWHSFPLKRNPAFSEITLQSGGAPLQVSLQRIHL